MSVHRKLKERKQVRERYREEGEPVCAGVPAPPAMEPPMTSRFVWDESVLLHVNRSKSGGIEPVSWRPTGWNELVKRRTGRCTSEQALCHTWWEAERKARGY